MRFNFKKTKGCFLVLAVMVSSVISAEDQQQKAVPGINKEGQQFQQTFQDADLKIINPILYINQRDQEDSYSFKGRTIVRYKTKIVLSVWNRGKQKCYFPTKVGACATGHNENTEILKIELEFAPDVFLVETDDRPRIPIVQAESSFEIAEIRPGEAAIVSKEMTITNENLSQAKQVVFVLKSEHHGRYSFWEGRLNSESFPLDSTPNFRIIK